MRIIRIFTRGVKVAFKSVFRNLSLSLASISSASITLIIVGIAILFTYNVNSITKHIEDVLTVVVFVDKNISEEDLTTLKGRMNSNTNINKETLIYKSQDDFVKYGESLASKLVSMLEVIRNACVITVIALILVTIFLISNTIKITIFSRRQEISIMRLVGTSNTVIKLPFLFEGFIIGIIGSIIPVLLTIFGYTFLYDYVGGDLFSQLIVLVNPASIVYITSLVLIIVGGLVGMFGSVSAVRRYLKI